MIKKILFTALSVVLVQLVSVASNDNLALGARSAAMGNATVASSDLWSVQNNQAGLAKLKAMEVGVYAERKFLLPQLGYNAFAFALPIKGGAFGLSYSRLGYAKYNENKVGLAFAKNLGENISASVQLDYLSKFIGENYGKSGTIAAEVGFQAKLVKGLSIGAHIFNPTKAKSADYNHEKIPTIVKVGLQYAFSEKVFWSVEAEKDIDFKPVLKSGIEYRVVEQFYIRAGVSTQPTLGSFGFGLNLKNLKIDFAATYHQQLGMTPHLGLSYTFNSNK